jgi:hypothetical protein
MKKDVESGKQFSDALMRYPKTSARSTSTW